MIIFTIYASHTCELILCVAKRFEKKKQITGMSSFMKEHPYGMVKK